MTGSVELVAERPYEHNRWPFVIRTFKTTEGYVVQSFLANMPVSHVYAVDHATYEARSGAGEKPIDKLVELAILDLSNERYRTWIMHWASQGGS